jgi:hypothetical protein
MLKVIVNFYCTFQIYPDMFRQVTAIFRDLHVPYKLLQYCLCFGRMWIMVRSVWPAAVECVQVCTGGLVPVATGMYNKNLQRP